VVLDRYARFWFIVDSSVVGYDGARNVKAEERSVGRKRLVRKAQPPSNRRIAWPRWTGFRGMTVRDWLQLLIVPFALVLIGLLFTLRQDATLQKIEDRRAQQAQKIENQRAEAERELADQRAQDEALQAYLDQMSGLLLERDLRTSKEDSEVRTLVRARTLTVLGKLDPSRKTAVMQFLAEAKLIQKVEGRGAIITVSGADLSGANLTDAADDLRGADLSFADLSGANLRGAEGITNEEVEQQAASLEGATMPNGQKYEDWLKDKKAQGKDEKNE
jgi:Pentapeptide repeats (8 copies)